MNVNRNGIAAIAIALVVLGGIWYYETHRAWTVGQNSSANIIPTWTGQYTFGEFAPPNETWIYGLALLNGSSSPSATLNINGFQTQIALTASVQETSRGTLEIFFSSDNGSQPPAPYSAGDLLFSLTKISKGFAIQWGKLKPMVPGDINGAVFSKATSSTISRIGG